MRPHPSKTAFTLIELLLVVGLIVIVWAMLLPPISRSPRKALSVWCMSNQRQIALGFLMWQGDHHGNFPWQVSSTNNGTMEPADQGYCLPNFDALKSMYSSNAYIPLAFTCPTDPIKTRATNSMKLTDQNISYFVGIDGGTSPAAAIVTGDRHLVADGKPVRVGLFAYSNNFDMKWSLELHGKSSTSPLGVIGFQDGHTQVVRNKDLNAIFRNQGLVSARYDVP